MVLLERLLRYFTGSNLTEKETFGLFTASKDEN